MSGPTTRSPNLTPRVVAVESRRAEDWPSDPFGTIASTNLQDAIEEIFAEAGSAPTPVSAGNLGAAHTETVTASHATRMTGTLTANLVLTPTLGANSVLEWIGIQDGLGGANGWTVTLPDGTPIPVPATGSFEITFRSLDATTTFVTTAGQGTPGTPGTNGTDGNTIRTTTGAPSNGVGVNGDYAYDFTARIMYGPKAAGAWPAGLALGSSSSVGLFGDGTDGAATLDGSASVGWATRSGSVYTVTQAVNLTALTINSGVTLVPAGWPVFVSGTLTNNGTIGIGGNAATAGGVAGSGTAAGRHAGGQPGGAGNTGAGTAGTTGGGPSLGGIGGVGSSGAAGAAGARTIASTTILHSVFAQPPVGLVGSYVLGAVTRIVTGGPGGGGGGGDGTNKGGGGGGGGPCVVIFAKVFTNSGVLLSTGGAGGTPTTGNCGGGGGGGGGYFLVYSLAAATMGTVTVTGGAAGAAVGTGTAGAVGTDGAALNVVLS